MDLSKPGLPLQVGGAALGLVAIANHWHAMTAVCFFVHLIGDALFFLQLRREGKV